MGVQKVIELIKRWSQRPAPKCIIFVFKMITNVGWHTAFPFTFLFLCRFYCFISLVVAIVAIERGLYIALLLPIHVVYSLWHGSYGDIMTMLAIAYVSMLWLWIARNFCKTQQKKPRVYNVVHGQLKHKI